MIIDAELCQRRQINDLLAAEVRARDRAVMQAGADLQQTFGIERRREDERVAVGLFYQASVWALVIWGALGLVAIMTGFRDARLVDKMMGVILSPGAVADKVQRDRLGDTPGPEPSRPDPRRP